MNIEHIAITADIMRVSLDRLRLMVPKSVFTSGNLVPSL